MKEAANWQLTSPTKGQNEAANSSAGELLNVMTDEKVKRQLKLWFSAIRDDHRPRHAKANPRPGRQRRVSVSAKSKMIGLADLKARMERIFLIGLFAT
ncbi:hypothetical protein [Bradyrhizobium sp. sBnM-33]|uniref:hypothetical protein n=1 Tax=Bradyrhizobium sp. sBnM-33 TaxID=2831780 RepID=UPI001BCD11BB|nr:hypothetical protein [Bradyrhizobium sp. sBnM-33]WOH49314.1 hypothetical protein RX328_35430 [Bradyrhizobium sp. sBnM-33]